MLSGQGWVTFIFLIYNTPQWEHPEMLMPIRIRELLRIQGSSCSSNHTQLQVVNTGCFLFAALWVEG